MTERYKSIQVSEIPSTKFTGYLWESDKQKPKVLANESVSAEDFKGLPFIIEGSLYAEDEKVSIQIKCIDGNYHIGKIDLSGLELKEGNYDTHSVKKYVAHRVGAWKQYKMLEAWKEVSDKGGYLAGMATLKPAWSAFIGFTNGKESNK